MNAPIESKTCQIDSSYCKFGSETLLKLLEVFDSQIDGVIKNREDIEYVHKTRVTSRRLRAALPLFRVCFPAKKFKEWTSQIKKVTRLLGNARDLDVQISFIEQYLKTLNSTVAKAGVDVLLKEHKNRRENVQMPVVAGLEKLKASYILKDIAKFCELTITEQSHNAFDPNQVLEKARWHVSFRLDDFLSMEQYVYLENERLKHHEMRIYAKKLRYSMEAFAPVYENKLAEEIKTIKAFQDVLGEMHDCDVWTDYIPKFINKTEAKNKVKKKTKTAKIEKPLLNLLDYVRKKGRSNIGNLFCYGMKIKKVIFSINLEKQSVLTLP